MDYGDAEGDGIAGSLKLQGAPRTTLSRERLVWSIPTRGKKGEDRKRGMCEGIALVEIKKG